MDDKYLGSQSCPSHCGDTERNAVNMGMFTTSAQLETARVSADAAESLCLEQMDRNRSLQEEVEQWKLRWEQEERRKLKEDERRKREDVRRHHETMRLQNELTESTKSLERMSYTITSHKADIARLISQAEAAGWQTRG